MEEQDEKLFEEKCDLNVEVEFPILGKPSQESDWSWNNKIIISKSVSFYSTVSFLFLSDMKIS